MNQPTFQRGGNFHYGNEWSSGLCECCSDCGNCCYAYFCMPCFMCSTFRNAGECCCTPFFCPFATPYLRTKIRAAYKIDGDMWKDVCTYMCCPFCTIIQMSNELKTQGDGR